MDRHSTKTEILGDTLKLIEDVIEICTKAVPDSETWSSCMGETYGPKNIIPRSEIKKVLYCVTPSSKIVEYANKNNYDLLIGHHPFVVKGIQSLLFHTALDMCEGGLNDQWRIALNLKNAKKYQDNLGWYGEIEPTTYEDLLKKVEAFTGGIIGQKKSTNKLIRTVITCSGLGGFVQSTVNQMNPDCFITGEILSDAKTLPLESVIETGHTLSEWCGVNLFKKLLEPHGIQVDKTPLEMDVFGKE